MIRTIALAATLTVGGVTHAQTDADISTNVATVWSTDGLNSATGRDTSMFDTDALRALFRDGVYRDFVTNAGVAYGEFLNLHLDEVVYGIGQ
ncbi:MAG: hypothetical protein AAF743_06565 [Planctomycetota bacterium]